MKQRFAVSFGYSQIIVYDSTIRQPGCNWTPEHFAQGFVRRDGVICFRTLLEYGKAQVEVIHGDYAPNNSQRVIRCPLSVTSGSVWVVGPEEWPEPNDHRVALAPGSWTVTCGQSILEPSRLQVVLWFSETAISQSQILVADTGIQPPISLIEVGEIA